MAVANLVLAAYMTGVIWLVQLVHYPLFAAVGGAQWPAYEAAHRRRITVVVGPAMLLAVAVAAALLISRPGVPAAANLGLALALLAGTLAIFAPLHARLEAAWDPAVHHRLVGLNWWRTAGWTAQLAVAVLLVADG